MSVFESYCRTKTSSNKITITGQRQMLFSSIRLMVPIIGIHFSAIYHCFCFVPVRSRPLWCFVAIIVCVAATAAVVVVFLLAAQ